MNLRKKNIENGFYVKLNKGKIYFDKFVLKSILGFQASKSSDESIKSA